MAKVGIKFLNTDPAEADFVDSALLPYGSAGATLGDVIDGLTAGDGLVGMWLTYTSSRLVTVQPGRVGINGATFVIAESTDVDIYYDFGDAGSPVTNTIYYLYAADELGVLNFYFSASVPVAPGVADTELQPIHRTVPMHHPVHADWRYIGQVLFRTSATILPFTVCTPTYWESAWASVPNTSTTITLEHGWGATPREVDYFFSDNAARKDNLMRTLLYSSPGNKLYGIEARNVSDKSVIVRTQKDFSFWNNETLTWVKTGYIKAIIRR